MTTPPTRESPGPGDRAVVAVDVGGTMIKSGVFGAEGFHRIAVRPTGRERGTGAVLAEIADVIDEMRDTAADIGADVDSAAVAIPGLVDEAAGVGRLSVTFGWHDLPLAERLSDVPFPVVVRHDVRSAARAEVRAGAAAGATSALVVVIGTGIAATMLDGGDVVTGATERAGEIGQVAVVDPIDGRSVTLEQLSSARAVADRYRQRSGDRTATAADVVARASAGDEVAAAVWSEAIGGLADVLGAAVALADPDVVVLGGGISRAGVDLLDPLRTAIDERLGWRPVPPLRSGRFADRAGLAGAALAAADLASPPIVIGAALEELAAAELPPAVAADRLGSRP